MGNDCLQYIVSLNLVWSRAVRKQKNRKTRADHSSACYTLRKPHSCEIVLPRTAARGSGHHKIHLVFSIQARITFHIIRTRTHFVDTSAPAVEATYKRSHRQRMRVSLEPSSKQQFMSRDIVGAHAFKCTAACTRETSVAA